MHAAPNYRSLLWFAASVCMLGSCSNSGDDCKLTATCPSTSTETGSADLLPGTDGGVSASHDASATNDRDAATTNHRDASATNKHDASTTSTVDASMAQAIPLPPPVVVVGGKCGDGLLASSEACDDGEALNTGAYGGCNADCTKAPYCGDGIISDGERCDPAGPLHDAGVSSNGCSPECGLSERCGDGMRTGDEQCDLGDAKNKGEYGGCEVNCTLAPHCGDGEISHDETCDLGSENNNGSLGGCNADCSPASGCNLAAGQVECGAGCVDIRTDARHCGACRTSCDPGDSCVAGSCKRNCGALTTCGDSCVDTSSNLNHCGRCNAPCGAVANGSASCKGGSCETACDSGYESCSGECLDTRSDVAHCGSCAPCEEKPNASVTCSSATCQYGCGGRTPLSCHSSSQPACGFWSFESKQETEGWTLRNIRQTAASDLKRSTEQSAAGSASLSFRYDANASSRVDFWMEVLVTPCSSATSAMALRYKFRAEADPGKLLSEWWYTSVGFDEEASSGYGKLNPSVWTEHTIAPPNGVEQVSTYHIGILLDDWGPEFRGTVYLDDIELVTPPPF